jgi:hypothetical protein
LGAAALLYFWRYLGWFGQQLSFGQSDFTVLFWPFHDFSVHEWLAGRVPLWNNSMYGGQPHLGAVEAGVFYPLSVVEVLLAGRGGVMTGIFTRMWLDVWVAAGGMYLLVRRLSGEWTAGLLAGAAFGFSGFMLGYGANQMDRLEALAFVPLGLFFLDRALLPPNGTALNAWLGGWCLACTLLGGYPQLWLILPVAVLVLVLGRLVVPSEVRVAWPRTAAVVGVGAGAALSLAAVQLAPAVEFLQQSERSFYLGEGYGYSWSQLSGLLVAGADGDKGMYVGIVPLLLIVPALLVRTNRLRALWWLAAAAVGLLLALGDTTPLYPWFFGHLGFGLFRGQNRNIALAVLCLPVLGGLGLAAVKPRLPRALKPVAFLLVALTAADLLAVNWDNNWPGEAALPVTDRSPHVVAALQTDAQREPMRFAVDHPHEFFVPNEAYRLGLESLDGYLNFKVGRTFEVLEKADIWRQWQLFNVRDVVSQRALAGNGVVQVPDIADGPTRVYRMEFPLPRAYLVWNATVVDSAAAALQATLDPAFDPGSTAVLEQPLKHTLSAPSSGQQRVTTSVPDPQHVHIQVSAPSDGLLVISEPYYPGWQADVDGQPASLQRANYALEALSVPSGEHVVSLRYDPASFKLGAALSILSVAALALIVVTSALRARRYALTSMTPAR